MSKISELSDGGVIQGGDTLIAVRSGGNVKVTYGGTTTANIDGGTIDNTVIGGTTPAAGNFTTGSFTGNVSFGDNDKAIFGAGSDLQIYHDGLASYIKENGTGDLIIQGSNTMRFQGSSNQELANFTTGGAVTLFNNGSAKLATTSTGIDVTGRTTTDNATVGSGTASTYVDLTVNGASTANYGPMIELQSAGTAFGKISNYGRIQGGTSTDMFVTTATTNNLLLGTNNTRAIQISSGGDISFYESTGTTPKLFWDSSAERLGVGATSLTHTLHVTGSSNEMGLFKRSAAGNSEVKIDTTTSGDAKLTFANDGTAAFTMGRDNSDSSFRIASGGALGSNDRLVINSSGNVGIATSSPSNALSVNGNMDITGTIALENSTGYGLRDNRNNLFLTTSADTAASNRTLTFGNATYGQTILDGGNVGIGTSPAQKLHVSSSSAIVGLLESTGSSAARLYFDNTGMSTAGDAQIWSQNNDLILNASGAERLRIASDGVVQISNTTPTLRLTDERSISWTGNETLGNIEFFSADLSASGAHVTGFIKSINDRAGGSVQVAGALTFGVADYDTAASEAMRIDSSGNLLVGKTTKGLSTDGVEARAAGFISVTANSQIVGYFNRRTSNGSILEFRKDNTAVGSIGTNGGDLFVGTGNTKLRFDDASDAIHAGGGDGSGTNAGTDLGTGTYKFGDLYLSGGVYLGGTGSANKLDDYEEGTWDPELQDASGNTTTWAGSAAGYYTKVGDKVTAWFTFSSSSTAITSRAYTKVAGLPFANSLAEQTSVSSLSRVFDFTWNDEDFYIGTTGTQILFKQLGSGNSDVTLTPTGTQQRLSGGVVYKVS